MHPYLAEQNTRYLNEQRLRDAERARLARGARLPRQAQAARTGGIGIGVRERLRAAFAGHAPTAPTGPTVRLPSNPQTEVGALRLVRQ